MATSSSKNYPNGDKSNMSSNDALETKSVLSELNEQLANLLVIYASAGGKFTAITLPNNEAILGTRHIIILPADLNPQTRTYSLQEIKDKRDEHEVTKEKDTSYRTSNRQDPSSKNRKREM